jgi:hypothetical protein
MPKKTKKRRVSRTTLIEQSLRDAQHVLSSYMESGGKQVSDTMSALMKIFESPKLGGALKTGPRRARSARPPARRAAGRHLNGASAGVTRKIKRKTARKSSPKSKRAHGR